MKTSSILAAAATTLIAIAAWGGGDLVRAFPGDASPAVVTATQTSAGTPYQWRDYWDRGGAEAATRACPARRSLSLSWEGPRLSWQRSCAHSG